MDKELFDQLQESVAEMDFIFKEAATRSRAENERLFKEWVANRPQGPIDEER